MGAYGLAINLVRLRKLVPLLAVLTVFLQPASALGIEVRVRDHAAYRYLDASGSSRPSSTLEFPFAIYGFLPEENGRNRIAFKFFILENSYWIELQNFSIDEHSLYSKEEILEPLRDYGVKVNESMRSDPSAPRDGNSHRIITRNWDDCVDCIAAILDLLAESTPEVLYVGGGTCNSFARRQHIKDLLDGNPGELPRGMVWLRVSEVKPFLHGQLRDKLPDAGGPAPAKSE